MRKIHILPLAVFAGVNIVFAKASWKLLFNSNTIAGSGWHIAGDQSFWTVNPSDKSIVGTSTRPTPYTMVFTDKNDFDQFTIKYQYRLEAGCSGFFFRAKEQSGGALVKGMQVEAKYLNGGQSEVGSLYCYQCTGGTKTADGWVVQHSETYSRRVAKPSTEYQQVYITVKSPNIYVNVNGFQAVGETNQAEITAGAARAFDYTPYGMVNTPGQFGLQIHGGQNPMNVAFRDIAILEGCNDEGPNKDTAQFVAGLPKQPAVYQHNAAACVGTSVAEGSPAPAHFGKITRSGNQLEVAVDFPGDHALELVNLQGKVVFSGTAPGSHDYRIDIPSQSGIYLAKIRANNQVASRKIVIP